MSGTVGPICYLCGAPATIQISADTPIGCDFPPVHYEQHDGVMLLTAYACTEHMWGVAADLSQPVIRPL